MPQERRRQVTDVRAMRALANPVRYRIFGHLMAVGPQTASQCADAVGATPSNCSYHLRELGRFGLVERVDDGSEDGRERPWRTGATGFSFQAAAEAQGDPAARAASRRLVHLGIDDEAALAHAATDEQELLPDEWQRASIMATYGLRIAPEELRALGAAVDALIRPFIGQTRADVPQHARAVNVTFRAFRLSRDG